MKGPKDRRRTRTRVAIVACLAAAPTGALVAVAGCSSDSTSSGGLAHADPGGTFGAEVTVKILGRGRVTTSIPGLDCPGDCFARFVFADPSAPGANGSFTLKASTTSPNVRFDGWKFETTAPLGTRGRGPDDCNPITRPGTSPSVDTSAAEISLTYGQVTGAPPAGKEAACGAYTSVPIAYQVTATFTDTTPPDAGFDANDGGPLGEIVYDPPQVGAVAREIGIPGNPPGSGSRLYWRYDVGGQSGIASGSTFSGTKTPTTVVSPSTPITLFDVEQQVTYQTSLGSLSVISNGNTFNTVLSGAPTCVGLASDTSSAYCRTAGPSGTIVSWTLSGTGPTTVYTTLPAGGPLAVDSSYFYVVDDSGSSGSAAIRRTLKSPGTLDAGAPTFTDLATGQTGPTQLSVSLGRMFWIDVDTFGSGTGLTGPTSFLSTPTTVVPSQNGLKLVATDPNSSTVAWFGTTGGTILRGVSGSTSTVFKQGIVGLGGLAVDSSYVYWTQSDGRVYRALKN